jgi:hypothetical protein
VAERQNRHDDRDPDGGKTMTPNQAQESLGEIIAAAETEADLREAEGVGKGALEYDLLAAELRVTALRFRMKVRPIPEGELLTPDAPPRRLPRSPAAADLMRRLSQDWHVVDRVTDRGPSGMPGSVDDRTREAIRQADFAKFAAGETTTADLGHNLGLAGWESLLEWGHDVKVYEADSTGYITATQGWNLDTLRDHFFSFPPARPLPGQRWVEMSPAPGHAGKIATLARMVDMLRSRSVDIARAPTHVLVEALADIADCEVVGLRHAWPAHVLELWFWHADPRVWGVDPDDDEDREDYTRALTKLTRAYLSVTQDERVAP